MIIRYLDSYKDSVVHATLLKSAWITRRDFRLHASLSGCGLQVVIAGNGKEHGSYSL